jgi:hypothetical protein
MSQGMEKERNKQERTNWNVGFHYSLVNLSVFEFEIDTLLPLTYVQRKRNAMYSLHRQPTGGALYLI